MQLYTCTVRLNGSMLNEVQKTDVTAAEIKVLKAIHTAPDAGVESIIKIAPTRSVDRSDDEERARLDEIYGEAVVNNERIRSLDRVLGFEGTPLPKTINGVDSLPPPKSGRRAPKVDQVVEQAPDPDPEPIQEGEFA
jgi:hypothetical protein